MCQNIDDFNRGSALVMAYLYRRFPRPCVLDVGRIEGSEDLFADGRPEPLRERGQVYVATVQFLADEGYLVYRHFDDWSSFNGVRLTSKGLAALNRVPEALQAPRKTLGDRLIAMTADLAGSASKEAVSAAVQVLLA